MSVNEIKQLRDDGNLDAALNLAKKELEIALSNLTPIDEDDSLKRLKRSANNEKLLWPKRNLAWVYYQYLRINNSPNTIDEFYYWLNQILSLQLPTKEKIFYDKLCWELGKLFLSISKHTYYSSYLNSINLLDLIKKIEFYKPSEAYSFMFKAMHKLFKGSRYYLKIADWWGFQNFMPNDYKNEKLPNGKEVMGIAEQAYIAYAKHLLPKKSKDGNVIFDKSKAEAFLPVLTGITEDYPHFQYPAYFTGKLLFALGDKENMIKTLLPFAKKKRNDFWVWEILAEAFSSDPEKVFACYCKALSCKSPEEMLVNLRQKMADLLLERKQYNEAKTEIKLLIEARNKQGYKIPQQVNTWALQDWHKNARAGRNNYQLYQKYTNLADALLYADIQIVTVIVEFVNRDKKMLNFIGTGNRIGFFKYERFFNDVSIGDVLDIRIQSGENEGLYHLYTAEKTENEKIKSEFIKFVSGKIKIPHGKQFGLLDDAFIHPSYISSRKLKDGDEIEATAIKTYNKEKKQWGWKLI
jgi:hypothetical protein